MNNLILLIILLVVLTIIGFALRTLKSILIISVVVVIIVFSGLLGEDVKTKTVDVLNTTSQYIEDNIFPFIKKSVDTVGISYDSDGKEISVKKSDGD